MDDDATAVKQRLSAGGVMRRLVAGDYAVDAVTMAKALVGAWLCRRLEDGTVIRRRITETEAPPPRASASPTHPSATKTASGVLRFPVAPTRPSDCSKSGAARNANRVRQARPSASSAPTTSTAPASTLCQRSSVGEETSVVCAARPSRGQALR